jgi:hypothetical protein
MPSTIDDAAVEMLSEDDLAFDVTLISSEEQAQDQASALCTISLCVSCIYSTECWTCHVCV